MWLALYFFGQYCFIYTHLYISQVHWNQYKTAYSPHSLLSPKVLVLLLYSLSQWIVLFILPKPEILESTLIITSPMSLISISCSLFVLTCLVFLNCMYFFLLSLLLPEKSQFFYVFLIFATFRSLLFNNIKNGILLLFSYSTIMVSF